MLAVCRVGWLGGWAVGQVGQVGQVELGGVECLLLGMNKVVNYDDEIGA